MCTKASCSTGIFTPAATCDGFGACKTVTPQNCAPFQCDATGCLKTCTVQSDCDASTSYCNTATGKCAAKNINGMPASQTYECSSGVVADGVCCNVDCTGCKACTNALTGGTTGQCLPVSVGKVAHNACTASGTSCGLDGMCDGAGACRSPAAGSRCNDGNACTSGETCQAGVCTGGTLKTCEASDQCHTAGTCDTATGSCSNPVKNGAACGTASCVSDSQGNASYTPLGTCNGSGTCTPGTSGPCPGFVTCASATTCKSTTCSTSNDCAAGYYCTGSGGSCTAKKSAGLPCGTADQCASNYCVDSVCCGTACNLASAASGSCMGCSNAAAGGPNGTCAVRNGAATHACPVSNPTACVNFQTDPDNCASCGHICPSGGLPSDATRSCIFGAFQSRVW